MTETQMWMLGQFLIVAGGTVAVYVSLAQRITRLETFFEVFGKKAAQILHSPHTPELDAYLDKYVKNDMQDQDWAKLLGLVELLEHDQTRPKEERALAAMVVIHCRKRLGLPFSCLTSHSETTTT